MIEDIFTIWLREMIRLWRSKSRIIGTLAMPFFYITILGAGFSGIVSSVDDTSYMQFLFPGIVGMTILFSSMFSGIS